MLRGLVELSKEDDIWEAIQLLNGDIYIYRKGYKEEALVRDVFKLISWATNQFSCFDANPVTPVKDSPVRLNRAVIVFAWYVDPNSDVILEIKKLISEVEG
jgi:hypothetical protein